MKVSRKRLGLWERREKEGKIGCVVKQCLRVRGRGCEVEMEAMQSLGKEGVVPVI